MNQINNTYKGIVEDLRNISNSPIGNIWDNFRASNAQVQLLWWESSPLAAFSYQWIQIWKNKLSLPLQANSLEANRNFSISQILSMLDTEDISLNHLGVRYQVDNIDAEVRRICENMQNDIYKVFEDREGRRENMRWLFVGAEDPKNPRKPNINTPMMEIILPHPDENLLPHFQFDIDTDLEQGVIDNKIKQWMRLTDTESPFHWSLDIPEIGTVVSMSVYNNTNQINYEVWIGNSKRSKQNHRNSMIMLD